MDVRIFLIPKREHPPTVTANKPSTLTSRGHTSQSTQRSQRCKYRETCRGNVDYTIQGIPHSAVLKEDSNRKETVKRLIQQFENHPICDSLLEDLSKTEEFNPFSEKSKELITSMGDTEYFKLCESSSKIQALIVLFIGKLASYTAPAANVCSRRKGIDS